MSCNLYTFLFHVGRFGLNTDEFGTFSGEVERTKAPLEAARQKCMRAIELSHCDLAVASEGSFGPHPVAGFLPVNEELLLFIDARKNIEIAVTHISTKTNFGSCTAKDNEELDDFIARAKFPEHAVILREPGGKIIQKGLQDKQELMRLFNHNLTQFGSVLIETDMRAHLNPMRMKNIYDCAKKLIATIEGKCPECAWPGFAINSVISGLPCENCDMPTKSTLKHVYICKHCGFTREKNNPHGKQKEDAMFCDFCNP